MADQAKETSDSLYESDFYAWTEVQANRLRARSHNGLDWDDLAEEIEAVGRSEKNQIRSRMRVLIKHLLKWEYQDELRSHSWQTTISEQRIHIDGIIETSPSLRRHPEDVLIWAYNAARRDAAKETGLDLELFPKEPAYSASEILNDEFFPGKTWKPEDLLRD